MHNRAFAALGLDYIYMPIEVGDVGEFFARFVRPSSRDIDWRLRGFSVTIPHKTSVIPYVDELDASAANAGAVNTVVINDSKLIGYNTDVEGAMRPLERMIALKGVSCGVIGAGGAARAVVYGLKQRGAQVRLFARDIRRARPLAESFGVPAFSIESLESSDVQIVINTTPVGMLGHGEGSSPIERSALSNRLIAYDLVYNPLETRFLKEAREEGCRAISGIEMLIEQAALQFELWTNQRPPLDLIRAAALEKLARTSK
jgi:shikimate dehydrogenase